MVVEDKRRRAVSTWLWKLITYFGTETPASAWTQFKLIPDLHSVISMALPGPSNSNKRTAEMADLVQASESVPHKTTKGWLYFRTRICPNSQQLLVHPFFHKLADTASSGSFIWLDPLGHSRSCLHALNLKPKSSSKVAAFDLDGTLIKSEFPKMKGISPLHWEWWRASIPAKLKELSVSG